MNITDEQKLELAQKATGKEWMIVTYPNGGGIGYVVLKSDPENVLWKPDLNGKDWQKAQALAVIVAASKLPNVLRINTHHGQSCSVDYLVEVERRVKVHWTKLCPDILTAAFAALLQEGR